MQRSDAACLSLIIVLALGLGCSSRDKQTFSTPRANYTVYWTGRQPTRVECTGSDIPGGRVRIDIERGHKRKEVLINNEHGAIWSREILTPGQNRGSSLGVTFHEESQFNAPYFIQNQEWRFETNGMIIYREETQKHKSGQLYKETFFGPFGIELKRS